MFADTDSIMVYWGVDTVEEANALAFEAEEMIKEYYDSANLWPMAMAYEKTAMPFLLMKRKNYVMNKYEPNTWPGKLVKDKKSGGMIEFKPKIDSTGNEFENHICMRIA